MITYDYYCTECEWEEELFVDSSKDRDKPLDDPCPSCGKTSTLKRGIGSAAFTVPEGGCGNANNGYSSYFGDSEIAKAKPGAERDAKKKEFGIK